MQYTRLFAFAFTALTACAQNPSGSIDATAIPAKVFARYTRQNAIKDLWTLGKNNPSEAEIMARVDAYGVCASLRSSPALCRSRARLSRFAPHRGFFIAFPSFREITPSYGAPS